ncbi:MAG: Do family serine endopeptidase [Bacteroidales bacterium]|nr:Do family serine endopeptidase [Bacteroidales bacterium]
MKNAGKIALGLMLVASVSAGVSYLTIRTVQSNGFVSSIGANGQNVRLVNMNAPSGMETDFTIAAENSVNAVVHIASKSMRSAPQPSDIFDYFFGGRGQMPQQSQPQVGYGSGVIISQDGYIVTNNHVVEGADEISVTLNERTTYPAKVIGSDPNTDIALIKIDGKDLPAIAFGNSDNLKVGEWVLAVGNPMNLASTVTAGIVSAKARNLGIIGNEDNPLPFRNQRPSSKSNLSIESFIQTDAAVNPGNSGGALVNLRGELVGINTAIISPTGSFAGYSFAVPVNIVAKVVGDMKQFGTVQRAMLGISIRDINSELAKEKNFSVQDGVYVESVSDRSAAKEAGLKSGDIIKQMNHVKIATASELQEQVGLHRPGDVVDLTIIRDNKSQQLKVTLKNIQGDLSTVKVSDINDLGAAFAELTDAKKNQLNISYGVEVSGVTNGKFKQAGIRKGYVILKMNDQRIDSVAQLEEVIKNARKNAQFDERGLFIVGMYPNGKVTYYAIDLAE